MTVPTIISGMGKATNFKFGRYIQKVHTNKSPLKIWENRERGRIQVLWSSGTSQGDAGRTDPDIPA